MNEKLMDLANQAGFFGESLNPILGTCQETALNNYAELIITHASECVRDVLRDENSTLSYDDASLIQKRIKQCFGVNQ